MIPTDPLFAFAQIAFGLAAVSGVILMLARGGPRRMNSLYRARIAVLFQLTSVAFFLCILPMTLHANRVDDLETLHTSSRVMSVLLVFSILLTRWTYRRARAEFGQKITTRKRLLFFGPLGVQLVFSSIVSVGLWDPAGMGIYLAGLTVLLALAIHQLIRFVGTADLEQQKH